MADQYPAPLPDFRRVFEACPSPILVLAPDLTIVAANRSFRDTTQIGDTEIINRALFEVFPANPADPEADGVERLRASLLEVLQTRQTQVMRLQRYDIVGPDGSYEVRYWSPINVPVLDDAGEVVWIVLGVEDATGQVLSDMYGVLDPDVRIAATRQFETLAAESLRRGRALNEANARLAQANDGLSELNRASTAFFNEVSHELRTPLTLLQWSLEQLRRSGGPLNDPASAALTGAERAARRLLRLVNDLLEFSRIEAGGMPAEYRPTALAELTTDLANQFRPAIEQAGLELEVDCPPLGHAVYVDSEMWEKIVFNLLSNALRFTSAGRIVVSLRQRDESVELTVRDTGIGIAPENLARVFDRFYRVRGAVPRGGQGTGIGLPLVRGLTGLHRGDVRVDSRPGEGTSFVVSVPLGRDHLPRHSVREEAALIQPAQAGPYLEEVQAWLTGQELGDAPQPAVPMPSHEQAAEQDAARILVVDDNAEMAEYMSRLLGERFRTSALANGESALRAVLLDPPDVLVTDLMMGDMSGLDLLRAIRSDTRVAMLPVVIVSGKADNETRSIALEAGANDFLVKPFSGRELLARIGALVDHVRSSRLERSLRAEAEAARARMWMVLESVSEAFLALDRNGRITFANGRALHWMDRADQNVVGQALASILPESRSGEFRKALQHALEDGESAQFDHARGRRYWRIAVYPCDEGLVLLTSDITERKATEARALHLARHDPLTDLPNRSLLYELGEHMLASAARAGDMLGVCFIDLDRFKLINDTYGHKTGDLLLQEVARRIARALRNEDWVARFGGDEFVVLLPKLHSARDAARVAAHVLDTLRAPMRIEGADLHCSPSIGISLYPQDGDTVDALIQSADAAMYHAKDNGRNNYQFYTAALGHQAQATLAIEQRLRNCVEDGGRTLALFYQPVIDVGSGALTGVEALLRWVQPDSSYLSPEVFIPVAENTGLIQPLGQWVFEEAYRQHRAWEAQGLPAVRVAVNVSAVQFRHQDFLRNLEQWVRSADIDPKCLMLELTESALMKDVDLAIAQLKTLRSIGVQVALDDFGTGYSSLSQLARLPLDKLKIDRSFVRNLKCGGAAPAIVDAIIVLGRTLDLEIVAEGVETIESLDFLRERACHHAQGYYFGRPMPAAQFADWVRDRPRGGIH